MKLRRYVLIRRVEYSGAMTDLSFLLIIFFLIAASFASDKGIYLRLPDKDSEPIKLKPDEVIYIKIEEPGKYSVDNFPFERAGLIEGIKTKAALLVEPVAIVEVQAGILYQEVLSVLESAKMGGCDKFSITFQKEEPIPVEIDKED